MKKFKFKLDSLLRVRKIKEDLQVKKHSQLVKELSKANDDLTNLKKQIVNVYETHEKDLESQDGLAFIKEAFTYLVDSKEKIKQQKILIEKREQKVSKQRENLLDALKQRKIIEKYKEQKIKQHKSDSRKKELKQLDDIIQSRIKEKKS
jgi:flagellar protein FliJ